MQQNACCARKGEPVCMAFNCFECIPGDSATLWWLAMLLPFTLVLLHHGPWLCCSPPFIGLAACCMMH